MSQAPFKLVDEINQGMDATNERNIFRQVCRTSCVMDEIVAQTFVISPKLLTNLDYTEGSTVHVVFSGTEVHCADEQNEHDPSVWNVRDFLDRADGGSGGTRNHKKKKRNGDLSSGSSRASKRLRVDDDEATTKVDGDDDVIVLGGDDDDSDDIVIL